MIGVSETFLTFVGLCTCMSHNPENRTKDGKKAAEENLSEPVDKQDPTQPAEATGGKEGKGAAAL